MKVIINIAVAHQNNEYKILIYGLSAIRSIEIEQLGHIIQKMHKFCKEEKLILNLKAIRANRGKDNPMLK